MNYYQYISSDEWQSKRKEVFEVYGERCFFCHGHYMLSVHHISYENLGGEKTEELVPPCGLCHQMLHKDPSGLELYFMAVHKKQITIKDFMPNRREGF